MQERGIDRCRTRVKGGLALVSGLGLGVRARVRVSFKLRD